jgi:peptidyl-prolyl cis-trans isomerase D
MRSSAKFVMWILLIAFVGGFLLVETSGLLGRTPVTPTTAVATVNGTDILYTDWQRRAQQLVQQEQQQSGRSLTQDEIRRIDNQAFDDMVAEILLEQEYRKRGIVVSTEELRDYARFAPPQWVRTAPDLQTDGRFDPVKYQRLLASSQARQTGLLVALEQYFRSEIPKEKLFEQVTGGVYVPDAELWRAWQDANDSASINFVAFRPKLSAADSSVSDADVRAYYDGQRGGACAHQCAACRDRRWRQVRGGRQARVDRQQLRGERRRSGQGWEGALRARVREGGLRAQDGRALAAGAHPVRLPPDQGGLAEG